MKYVTKVCQATLIFICLLFCSKSVIAQKGGHGKDSTTSPDGHSTVIKFDMSRPSTNAVSIFPYKKKHNGLEIQTSRTVGIELINCNPLKYKYFIDSKPISFFDNSRDPFDTIRKLLYPALDGTSVLEEKSDSDIDKKSKNVREALTKLNSANPNAKDASIKTGKSIDSAFKGYPIYESFVAKKGNFEHQINTAYSFTSLKLFDKKIGSIKKSVDTVLKAIELDDSSKEAKLKKSEAYLNALSYIHAIWMEARNIVFFIDDYKSKSGAEDFMPTVAFAATKDSINKHYDSLIEHYKVHYADIYYVDQSNFSSTEKKDYDSITKKLSSTIHDLNSNRKTFQEIQLYYYSSQIDINGQNIDALEISIQRTNDKTGVIMDKNFYKFWIRGGVKIDISGGIFLTTLVDRQYSTTADTTAGRSSFKTIQEKNIGTATIGFGSLLSIGLRNGSAWIKPSLGFGLLFTTSQKFQLLSGIGCVIGKEQRIILHGGLSFANVTKLDSKYAADNKTFYNLGTQTDPPTLQRFEQGYYVGLTYNISKPQVSKKDQN